METLWRIPWETLGLPYLWEMETAQNLRLLQLARRIWATPWHRRTSRNTNWTLLLRDFHVASVVRSSTQYTIPSWCQKPNRKHAIPKHSLVDSRYGSWKVRVTRAGKILISKHTPVMMVHFLAASNQFSTHSCTCFRHSVTTLSLTYWENHGGKGSSWRLRFIKLPVGKRWWKRSCPWRLWRSIGCFHPWLDPRPNSACAPGLDFTTLETSSVDLGAWHGLVLLGKSTGNHGFCHQKDKTSCFWLRFSTGPASLVLFHPHNTGFLREKVWTLPQSDAVSCQDFRVPMDPQMADHL